MIRLFTTALVSFVVVVCDITGHFAFALGAGVIVGALFFVASAVSGSGLRPTGLAAPHLMPDGPKRPSDTRAGIGCALAASGIASSAVTNLHYPLPFRIFYGFCIAAGVAIAVGLAWRSRNAPPEPPRSNTEQ